MKHHSRLFLTIAVLSVWLLGIGQAVATSGCRAGGVAAANAYVHMNPIYAQIYGSLEDYVQQNGALFTQGSDAVRCLAALSRAALSAASQVYDPADIQKRNEMNARLGAMGINPGPARPSASGNFYTMSLQLARLARTLPAAANGDFRPYYTPTNDIESAQILAARLLPQMMQDPMLRSVFVQQAPLIKRAAQTEFEMILHAARRLSNAE